MFVGSKRSPRRIHLSLTARRKVNRRVISEYIGALGSIPLVGPISAEERARYWGRLDARLADIAIRHPLTAADFEKIKALVARRIAPPSTPEERRLLARAALQRDLVAALDGGADAMAEAARRLWEMAREAKREMERSKA
jgi:hypothetical protein